MIAKLFCFHFLELLKNPDYAHSLDWDYFWRVEVPDWWYINFQSKWNNLWFVRWGRFILSQPSPDNDKLPF